MQTANALGYSHGPGRDMWFEMGWSTKPRYKSALVGNWSEDRTESPPKHTVRICVCLIVLLLFCTHFSVLLPGVCQPAVNDEARFQRGDSRRGPLDRICWIHQVSCEFMCSWFIRLCVLTHSHLSGHGPGHDYARRRAPGWCAKMFILIR